jgi:hypothetical protein
MALLSSARRIMPKKRAPKTAGKLVVSSGQDFGSTALLPAGRTEQSFEQGDVEDALVSKAVVSG